MTAVLRFLKQLFGLEYFPLVTYQLPYVTNCTKTTMRRDGY